MMYERNDSPLGPCTDASPDHVAHVQDGEHRETATGSLELPSI